MNLQEEISKVAFELFASRNCIHGRDFDDWLEAERIVLSKHSGQELEEPEDVDIADEMAFIAQGKLEIQAGRHSRRN